VQKINLNPLINNPISPRLNNDLPEPTKGLEMKTEYKKWLKKARTKGWKTPVNDALPEHSWVAYWQACAEYERNPSAGRPVVPHRSA